MCPNPASPEKEKRAREASEEESASTEEEGAQGRPGRSIREEAEKDGAEEAHGPGRHGIDMNSIAEEEKSGRERGRERENKPGTEEKGVQQSLEEKERARRESFRAHLEKMKEEELERQRHGFPPSDGNRFPTPRGSPRPQAPAPPEKPSSKPFRLPSVSAQTVIGVLMLVLFGITVIVTLMDRNKQKRMEEKMMMQRNGGRRGPSDAGENASINLANNVEYNAKIYSRVLPNDCKKDLYIGLENEFDSFVQENLPIIMEEKQDNINESMKNVLLYGKPGTGKTFFARKLLFMLAINIHAHRLMKEYEMEYLNTKSPESLLEKLYECNNEIEMYTVSGNMLKKKHVGESEEATKQFFDYIESRQKDVPILLLIDEAETLLHSRTDNRDGGVGVGNSLIGMWLAWLDGTKDRADQRVFIVAATNHRSRVDEAILRRFGKQIGVAFPEREERKKHIDMKLTPYIEGMGTETSGIMEQLLDASENVSLSTINRVAMQVKAQYSSTRKLVDSSIPEKAFRQDSEANTKKDKDTEAENKKRKEYGLSVDENDSPTQYITTTVFDKNTRDTNYLVISKKELETIESAASRQDTVYGDMEDSIIREIFKHLPMYKNKPPKVSSVIKKRKRRDATKKGLDHTIETKKTLSREKEYAKAHEGVGGFFTSFFSNILASTSG
ncbi:hypothetical protein NECID01_1752 [Nematocida sp. AWRm77]|nr:hypothetical protein NECID01_1752 [Nematocida sp. AWRm77]